MEKNQNQKQSEEEDKQKDPNQQSQQTSNIPLIKDQQFLQNIQSFQNKPIEQLVQDKKFQELIKERKFWGTQPVLNPKEAPKIDSGPLEQKKTKEQLEKVIKLPSNFKWSEMDLEKNEILDELYTLLYENYVEDDDGCFRFNYSRDFLKWALMHPGYKKELFFGIRDSSTNNLLGFISGIVLTLIVEGKHVDATEVNFLCVNKKLRKLHMAAILIREVVRRSNLMGVWQGIYTSGTMLITPFAQTRYWHRSLNPQKLIDVKFSYLPPKQKLSTRIKLYQLPDEIDLPPQTIIRHVEQKDMKQLKKLFTNFISQFKIYTQFTKKDFCHYFLRRENILESYVLEKNGVITDFFSFYCLPSTILNHPKYNELKAAYSYYFVNGQLTMKELYKVALIKARQLGYDVFNALDIMQNNEVFEELLFAPGDGYLQFYLYNWKLQETVVKPSKIGIVLM